MIPDKAGCFVDDMAVMGPGDIYKGQTIEGNSLIRRFVWEFAHMFQKLLAWIEISGATISGDKLIMVMPKLELVSLVASLEGIAVSHGMTSKVLKWPACQTVLQVRGFLGTVGIARHWIKGFASIAKPLTFLMRIKENKEFIWTQEVQDSMDMLKHSVVESPALRPIDCKLALRVMNKNQQENDKGLVIIAVDSSVIGAGWVLLQIHANGEFPGSVMFCDTESRYSQLKLEL
jgi:hypothetical protein